MTTLDLTTFTEVDPGANLSETSSTLTFTSLTNNNAYLYKDYGAAYFAAGSTKYIEGKINISAASNTVTFFLGFGAALGNYGAGNSAGVLFQYVSSLVPYIDLNIGAVETDGTNIGSNPSLSTDYYYRIGMFPALGHFGALGVWLYSDSGRTTLVNHGINQLPSAQSFRYLYALVNLTANSGSLSGTNANITLYEPAAGADLTTFTEVDPNSHLAQYADCSVVTTLNTNETAYLYKDETAGYISANYTFQAALNITAFASGSGQMLNLLSVVNTLGHANLTNDLHGIAVEYVGATTFALKAREVTGSTEYLSSASSTLDANTPYWIQINRDVGVGTYGTLYVKVFSDPAYANQVGSTVSLTLHDNGTPDVAAFRYLLPVQSYNTGSSRSATFTLGTVNVTILPPPNVATVAWTEADDVVSVTAIVPNTAAIAWTEADDVVSVTGTKNSPVAQIAFTEDDDEVAATGEIKFHGSVAFTEDDDTVSVTANVLIVIEPFTVRIRHKTTGAAITGLTTVVLRGEQPATGYLLDFDGCTFKASPITPTLTLDEVDAVTHPGVYRANVATTLFAGWVEFEASYNDGSYIYMYANEAYYTAGARTNGVWSVAQQGQINNLQAALAAAPANAASSVWEYVTEGTTSAVEVYRGMAAVLIGIASGMETNNPVFRDLANTKNRVSATADAHGNRSVVTHDLT